MTQEDYCLMLQQHLHLPEGYRFQLERCGSGYLLEVVDVSSQSPRALNYGWGKAALIYPLPQHIQLSHARQFDLNYYFPWEDPDCISRLQRRLHQLLQDPLTGRPHE